MLNFCNDLYVGEQVHRKSHIIRSLKAGKKLLSTYVLVMPESYGQLEIYHNLFLRSGIYRDRDFDVVGIAASYEDAKDLVLRITTDCFAHRQDGNIKAFLTDRIC